MSTLERGVTVAGYRVDGVLGAGGMGVVYRATQLSLNRVVALKVLSVDFSMDKGFRERFRREGMLQAAIDHPHIVTVYEAGESDHGLFIAMRVVQGPTLKDLVGGGRLDPARAVTLLSQVADALDAAHEKGLIHRDVKPQNILIDARDQAYLADFGLTRGADAVEGPTETGQFVGTLDDVSPEQARGEGATAASDIYALTGVLYESLTGEVPYPRTSEPAVMFAHLSEPPPRPTERRPDLPAAIDDVIGRGMAKDPAQRPPTARALLDEAIGALDVAPGRPAPTTRPYAAAASADSIAPLAASGATRVSMPTAPAEAPAAPAAAPRSRRGLVAAIVVGVAVLAAVGFVIGHSGSKDDKSGSGPALTQSASAGEVELSFPAAWRRVTDAPDVPGTTFAEPMVLANPAGGRMTAGTVDSKGPSLLPDGLLKLLGAKAPKSGEPVALGAAQAFRYRGLAVKGAARPLTIYTAPTTAGVVTLACSPPPVEPAAYLATCERVAGTLRLLGAKPYPLGPDSAHAKALTKELVALRARREPAERILARARTPAAQARAAAALAATYAASARRLGDLEVSPYAKAANVGVVTALDRTAKAYAAAASAARRGDRAGYVRARGTLRRASGTLTRALAMLRELGYATSG